MQKAPVLKGSGLKPLTEDKPNEDVHVFGRNLEERVVTKDEGEEKSPSISFNIVGDCQVPEEDDIESIRKRKFDAITGEEDEVTVFQGDFKLFVWDLATSNWIEKGRGLLKLNDSIGQDEKRSRLIMRVSGTLRIILNVAIRHSNFRVTEHGNSKTNIRFTDMQTFWAARGSNAHQLKDLLEERLKISEKQTESISAKKKAISDDEDDDEAPSKKKAKSDDEDDDDDDETPSEEKSKSDEEDDVETPPREEARSDDDETPLKKKARSHDEDDDETSFKKKAKSDDDNNELHTKEEAKSDEKDAGDENFTKKAESDKDDAGEATPEKTKSDDQETTKNEE